MKVPAWYVPFTVSVGRALFLWRESHLASSNGSWVKGHIWSVCAIPRGITWDIAACITCEDGCLEEVKFSVTDGNQTLTCSRTGKTIRWKHAGGDLSPATLHCSADLPLTRYAAEGRGTLRNRRTNESCEGPHSTVRSTISESPILRGLELRVQQLESIISRIGTERNNLNETDHSLLKCVLFPERLLQQLRGKMEMILDRPVQTPDDEDERKLCIRNDNLRCSVDCSLGEFRELCLAIKKDRFISCTFLPQSFGEESTISGFANTSIQFLSFGDICGVLAECEEQKLVRIIMKARRRRTRSSPAMIRIIGDAVIPVQEGSDPCYIFVGSCLSEETIWSCKRPLPVLMIQNMVQDEMDMMFVNELETSELGLEELRKVLSSTKTVRTVSEAGTTGRRKAKSTRSRLRGFELRWAAQKENGTNNLFEERKRSLKKAGYLELFLPVVYCWNMSHGEELLEICKHDFLTTCIQRFSSRC